MKRKIRSSYGDVVLTKFVLVPMEYLEQYPDNYSKELEGYFYTWNYTYNKFTHDTDDRNKSHSSVIDSLPVPIRTAARELNIWGKTDWFKNSKRFIIVNEEYIDSHQIAKIRRACNV